MPNIRSIRFFTSVIMAFLVCLGRYFSLIRAGTLGAFDFMRIYVAWQQNAKM
jgi:hypothetical protein